MTKTIINIEVVDAEKRRVPSKHYVYVIVVKWSDNSSMVVYRRYSRFFDLQTQLLDKFPIEAGSTDPALRVIPFLPGKIFFGRSQIRDVAMKRLGEIDAYCKSILKLPKHIAECDEVLAFFEVEEDDLDPPKEEPKNKGEKKVEKISGPKQLDQYVAVADYSVEAKGEMNLTAGMVVEVTEKSESGWWFVNAEEQQGWVPSTYLEPVNGTPASQASFVRDGQEEKYICIEAFCAQSEDEISLEKGVVVEVKQKSMDGWWMVKYQGKEGYAPATYLKKSNDPYAKSLVEKSRQSGVKIIGNLADVSNLLSGSSSPRNSGIFSHSSPSDSTRHNGSENRVSKASRGNDEEDGGDDWSDEENDALQHIDSKSNTKSGVALAKMVLKQRSLERGGSLKPPPRQNSIQKMVIQPMPPPASPARSSLYVTVCDFEDTVGDGVSFVAGEIVTVLEKSSSGWWFVERGEDKGWVPESYLEQDFSSQDQSSSEDTDITTDGNNDAPQPSSAALAEALNLRLKGKSDNTLDTTGAGPPKLPSKTAGKGPPSLPAKPKETPVEDTDSAQGRESVSGLAGALKAKFESTGGGFSNNSADKTALVGKLSGKPTPPSLPLKHGDKPKPPGLPSKPGDKPAPPGLPVKPSDKPHAPQVLPCKLSDKQPEKIGPPWLANKHGEKPGLPSKTPDKVAPPCLPNKPVTKPEVPPTPKKPDDVGADGESGNVSGLASALKSKFESQQQGDKALKPAFQPKPTPLGKPFGSGDAQPNKPSVPGKPTIGSKPSFAQKPSLPAKSDSHTAAKVPTGPPKLPSKPQLGAKPSADSNNNSNSGESNSKPKSNKVQSMAAALGSAGIGQNVASTKPSLPIKKPAPTSTPKPSPDIATGKPRVGSLVSELGGKLNLGNKMGVRSPEPSPVSKTGAWSCSTVNSQTASEPSPVSKSAPWPAQNMTPKSSPSVGTEYEVIADFAAEGEGELAIQCGEVVEVLDREQDEWWLVRLRGEEGWVPSSYLEPAAEWDD